MKETKSKYAIYLYPSQMEEIKNLVEQGNAKSQSEFVSDAIRFYVGYLQQGQNVDYLAPIIVQSIKAEIGSVEKNICQILFKLAVESAMLSNLEAIQVQVSDAQMQQLRKPVPGLLRKITASSSSKKPINTSTVKEMIYA